MNKLFKTFVCTLALGATLVVSPTGVKAAQYESKVIISNANVCAFGNETRAYYDPCDQILRVGEYIMFTIVAEGGFKNYRVDSVDAAGDQVYSNELGAWIPAYSCVETSQYGGATGDQILSVGEYFTIPRSGDGLNASFTVLAVDGPSNAVKVNIKNKWRNWVPTWVNATPLIEYGCF